MAMIHPSCKDLNGKSKSLIAFTKQLGCEPQFLHIPAWHEDLNPHIQIMPLHVHQQMRDFFALLCYLPKHRAQCAAAQHKVLNEQQHCVLSSHSTLCYQATCSTLCYHKPQHFVLSSLSLTPHPYPAGSQNKFLQIMEQEKYAESLLAQVVHFQDKLEAILGNQKPEPEPETHTHGGSLCTARTRSRGCVHAIQI